MKRVKIYLKSGAVVRLKLKDFSYSPDRVTWRSGVSRLISVRPAHISAIVWLRWWQF